MNTAGWLDVWHLVLAIVARQAPFTQIMFATGAVFVVVMALEGLRTSLLAIWHAHKNSHLLAPTPRASTTLAMQAAAPLSKSFSVRAVARFASSPARRPKPLTLSPRNFRSPRPQIRRHPMLDFGVLSELPDNSAIPPMELSDAV